MDTTERSGAKADGQNSAADSCHKVVLIYKRNMEPDGALLSLIEKRLTDHGCEVFIDRHLTVGVAWAQEIEHRIRTADAVIPLISKASVESEMLEYELQTAWDENQKRGKPSILPVRVDYVDEAPQHVRAILDPLMYILWTGPQDNDKLAADLCAALDSPPRPTIGRPDQIESVGGAVPLESKLYIARPTDTEFLAAIGRRDSIVLVKGARQMGKTSLLARGVRHAREQGSTVVLTDLQKLNMVSLESPDALFKTLAEMLADQLDLDDAWVDDWTARRGPNNNFERFLRRFVLAHMERQLVWALDEVDRLLTCSFGGEVFGLFRSWHNSRSLDPAGPWSRLTLAIAYATEPHLFITDLNQSPFNVGTRLSLSDFTIEQVEELNRRHLSPLKQDQLPKFYELLSGHPYLTRKGLEVMVTHNRHFDDFMSESVLDDGPFGDHLRRLLVSLSQDNHLYRTVKGLVFGGPVESNDAFYRLRTAGIISGGSVHTARCRCELYSKYLQKHMIV